MIKVSVIVPVYNVEKYIDKCLKSLVNQTLKDIEIIIVNDESPDNSDKIISKYVKEYKNIKYYKKKNGGVSDARNYGIKKATGEDITFIDSDDYVKYDMYEKMYEKAKSGNFDMVVCDLNCVSEDNNNIKYIDSCIKHDTTNIKSVFINNYPVVWNRIIKRKFFDNGLEFKKNVWFEDVEFIYRLLPYIKSIGVIKEPFNQYVQRSGSITKSIDKRLYNYIDNWNGVVKFYQNNKFYDKYKNELEYAYVRYLYATFIKQATIFNKEEYNKAVNEAIINVKENFPKYRKNKYFYYSLKGFYLLIFNKLTARIMYYLFHKK